MLGVMAIHTLAWAGRDIASTARWYRILDLFARSAVPCFIVLTGVVLAHTSIHRRQDAVSFVTRRLARIGVPWLVWAGVWSTVWLLVVPLFNGEGLPSLADVFSALAEGPGYLYFLLLILQLSFVFVFLPVDTRARAWLAAGAVAFQVVLSCARLLLPDSVGPVWTYLDDHAYEIGMFWIGYFAVGVFVGSNLELVRLTVARVSVTLVIAAMSCALLVASPGFGWWDADRLAGANAFLSPVYLPVACSLCLLLYWASQVVVRTHPHIGAWASFWGAASFGVYLIHQYPLDILARLMQQKGTWISISDPLPYSLPALALLYGLVMLSSALLVLLLRRYSLGLLALGENAHPPSILSGRPPNTPQR